MKKKKLILIIDDDPSNIKVIMNLLKDEYVIQTAISGQKGLDLAFSDTPPDLILLDIMMPEIDGYLVCSRLKADKKTEDIPVIFLTSSEEIEDETLGFELGAVDYIIKPIQPMTLQSRISTHMQLSDQRQQLQIDKDRYDFELDLATKILQEFIPDQDPEIPGYEIISLFRPVLGIGGDYYDYFPLNESSTGIFQADVMSHGVPAALLTSAIRALFSVMNAVKSEPGKFLATLNNALVKSTPGNNISAVYGILSAQTNTFTYANAAHCIPLVYRSESKTVEEVPMESSVLGVKKQNKLYATETISLEKNDMLFLYTDGLIESIEKVFGQRLDKLKDAILALSNIPVKEILNGMYEHLELQLEQSGELFPDDLTIIGIRRTS